MSHALLETSHLRKSFGGLAVTRDVSLRLLPGERVGLIGPNGAGKTTLINLIAGVLPPSSGSVHLCGQDVSSLNQIQRVKRGLVRTFQITQLARTLPVQLQVEMAIHERDGTLGQIWRSMAHYRGVHDEARAILQSLRMESLATRAPLELAYGQQRLVEIALGIALRPKVLLLDEPMAGVPAADRQLVLDALASLPGELAVLMIEHDMDVVFSFAHRVIVLAEGAVLADDAPSAVRRNPAVRAAYLGQEA